MSFMNSIVALLSDVSGFFYKIYLEVYSWVSPFWYAAAPFYWLSLIFNNLAWRFGEFSLWVDSVAALVAQILNWNTIQGYIRSWLPKLEETVTWVLSWRTNVSSVVSSWWSATSVTVQSWIAAADQPFNSMLTAWIGFWNNIWPAQVSSFNSLKSAWDNFWTVTFPSLVSFTWLTTWWDSRLLDIQGLMDSAFTLRQGYWDGWQDFRGKVSEFFADPLEFLWARFTDWFLGPEG